MSESKSEKFRQAYSGNTFLTGLPSVEQRASAWIDEYHQTPEFREYGVIFPGDAFAAGWAACLEAMGTIEYGVTYTDPLRPVTMTTDWESALESQRFYNGIGEGRYVSQILQRVKGMNPGPWSDAEEPS